MRVHLVQYDIVWHDVAANIKTVSNLLSSLEVRNGDWIVLPEMWNTGFTMNPEELISSIHEQAVQFLVEYSLKNQVTVCGSMAVLENTLWRNRFFLYDKGSFHGYYDKRYLFSPAGENKAYAAGDTPVTWSIDGITIRPFICYDLRFAAWSFEPSAEVLIYVANWPETRIDQWEALLKARAIENQAFVLGVNRIGMDNNELQYDGRSSVYSYDGSCLFTKQNDPGVFSAVLDMTALKAYRRQLPFLKDR